MINILIKNIKFYIKHKILVSFYLSIKHTSTCEPHIPKVDSHANLGPSLSHHRPLLLLPTIPTTPHLRPVCSQSAETARHGVYIRAHIYMNFSSCIVSYGIVLTCRKPFYPWYLNWCRHSAMMLLVGFVVQIPSLKHSKKL